VRSGSRCPLFIKAGQQPLQSELKESSAKQNTLAIGASALLLIKSPITKTNRQQRAKGAAAVQIQNAECTFLCLNRTRYLQCVLNQIHGLQ
jgi:hypothetical protein